VSKSILTCLAALALLSAVRPAALAQGGREVARNAKLVARLEKARAENRRVEVKFKDGVNVLGRVGEVRERGFTIEPDNEADAYDLRGRGLVAAVLYEEVETVQYPSKVRKFFKGVGKGFAIAGMSVAFLPTYGVLALLGELPSC
jgi:hypothetical protein